MYLLLSQPLSHRPAMPHTTLLLRLPLYLIQGATCRHWIVPWSQCLKFFRLCYMSKCQRRADLWLTKWPPSRRVMLQLRQRLLPLLLRLFQLRVPGLCTCGKCCWRRYLNVNIPLQLTTLAGLQSIGMPKKLHTTGYSVPVQRCARMP